MDMNHRMSTHPVLRPALALALLLRLWNPSKAQAEDRIEYRYEDYREDNGRMHIRTHATGFEYDLGSKVTAKGLLAYDSVSGATPTGEPAPLGTTALPLATVEDIRRAFSFELGFKHGVHTTTPQISYSVESDYISKGLALTHTIDFNQKNTTLVLGVSHNFDEVGGGSLFTFEKKDATDFLVGVNQLLGPRTVFSGNVTMGYVDGYQADPYRRVMFLLPESPDTIFSDSASVNPKSESRPHHRFKQVGFFSLTQYVTPLNASVEGTYRIYHDDWEILSHTVSLTWLQKLGQHVTLSPFFRYYQQGAASFYAPSFKGVSFDQYAGGTRLAFQDGVFVAFDDDPSFPAPADQGAYQIVNSPARPAYYSADYRLSELQAFTYGVGIQVKLGSHVTLDAAYKRYIMEGLDRITPSATYPSAHVFTLGCGIWF